LIYLGVEMSQPSSGQEQKSRTLPLRSSSLVEPPQVSSSSSQQPPTGKKKSGGFFSMKRK
jgi:hypothetical protein